MAEVAPALLSKAAVRAQIDVTEANIDRLASQLQEERRSLARLWFMIAPVGTLPTELLTEIFRLSIEAAEPLSRGRAALQRILRLSQICSRWRRMVISSPSLWALCTVDAQLYRDPTMYLDLLERSAKLPISVSLTTDQKFRVRKADAPPILSAIMPTAARWRDLDIDILSVHDLVGLNVPHGTFTGLESLRIHGSSLEPVLRTGVDVFASSRRLSRLTLCIEGSWSQLQMPWIQLTHLKLRGAPPLVSCLSILRQCTNLVSATVTTGKDDPQIELELLTLPYLKTLSLNVMNRGKFVPFFAKLGLPALQTLDLSCFYAREPWPANFSIFQSRAPNIKHISLRGCPRHSSELIDLLRLIPALIKLTLVHMNCLDSLFLQAFSCDGVNTKRLVPQLCELDWWGHEENLSGAPALIAAIRSRWSATSSSAVRLRAVKLSGLDASMAEELCRSVEDLSRRDSSSKSV